MKLKHKLIIAISSRALFDLDKEHEIFTKSKEEYERYQMDNANVVMEKGGAFQLISKLMKLNESYPNSVEVWIVSQNSMVTGQRIIRSAAHYNLGITRFLFTGGDDPFKYLVGHDTPIDLFLSQNTDAITRAIEAGIPAAHIVSKNIENQSDKIRVAFDGDSVLFEDSSEVIYQNAGLEAFQNNEHEKSAVPLGDGPLKKLLFKLDELRKIHGKKIEIGLCTARGGVAIERVLTTFQAWGIYPDQGAFLAGLSKKAFLKAFNTDIFFDDHMTHISEAKDAVVSAHIPVGGANK